MGVKSFAVSAVLLSWATLQPAVAQPGNDEAPALPRYEGVDCWFDIDEDDRDDRRIDCGRLFVPENWDDPKSQSITLPVVHFSARGDRPIGEPVIYLLGGPNQRAGLKDADSVRRSWIDDLRGQLWTDWHDVIVITPRGANLTDSNLDCPELRDPMVLLGAAGRNGAQVDWRATYWPAYARCIERLKRTHDLDGYALNQMTVDVLALVQQLELEKWSMLGVSFGTRLALEVMRAEPLGLQKVILDSVMPPGTNIFRESPMNTARALRRLFLTCKGDLQCARDYPDPEALLAKAMAYLEDQAFWAPLRNDESFGRIYYDVHPFHLINTLVEKAYSAGTLGEIPSILSDVLADDLYSIRDSHWRAIHRPHEIANAAFELTYCAFAFDDAAETDWDQLIADYPLYESWIRLSREFAEHCADWPVALQDPAEEEPVMNDIPTLVLNGFFDPVTPPEYARQAAATLSRSQLFVFDRQGHNVLSSSICARTVASAFMRKPSVRPEIDCSLLDPKIVFKQRPG